MNPTRDEVILFLSNLSSADQRTIIFEANRLHYQAVKTKYDKGRKYRESQTLKQEEAGELFKKIVKPGDIIRVRGTKDGVGLREVLETNKHEVVCRKLSNPFRSAKLKREKYLTTHYWSKIKSIENNLTIQE
jgi:hypothetical protein